MFVLLDLAILFAILALIFWILSVCGVFPLGAIAYVLLVVAIVLFIIWLIFRILGGRSLFGRNRTIV